MSLSAAEDEELLRLLLADEPLLDFVPRISPRFTSPAHLAPVAALLERAMLGEPVRALVSVPPRHGKSELLLHAIAWWLARRPADTLGYVSYAADIARSKSRLARDYAGRAGVTLRDDSAALHEWRTTANGGCLAAGIGGPLTGHGVNGLIVDDPLKNRQDAESPLIRGVGHQWFTSTAMTRVEPGGFVIVNATRWHDDDLIGRLAQDADTPWEVVNLPAVSDAGDALWPERWPLGALRARRAEVGEYDWHALYMGAPRPKGGEVFRVPARYESLDVTGARIVIGCDPAGTEDTRSDYTAAVVLAVRGFGAATIADVIEVVRFRGETPQAARELLALQAKWRAPLTIEASRDGKAIVRALRSIDPRLRITEIAPRGDKFVRAQPCAAAWNEGRVRLPMKAAWLADYVHEMERFTGLGDAHDDMADATVYAWTAASVSPVASARIAL